MIGRFYSAWLPLMMALIICDACPAAPIKVFLMGGQSNMRGRANVTGLPAALLAPQEDVLICRGSQGTVGTTLEFLQPNNVALDGTTFGPDLTFGRTIADYFPAADFVLLKYAVGGTSLGGTWKIGTGTTYLEFRQTVTNGLALLVAAGYEPEIVGMIWHQGESNIGNTQAKYESLLNDFIADMRLNYGANLPFMIGEIGLIQPGSQVIVDAQKAVATADPYAVFVPASDLSFFDNYHFDRNGMVTLGERFAHYYQANFATLINGPGPDTTAPAPNPMSWATPPTAASSTSITMTATSASDSSGVQYFFDCTTAGGHDSAWQDSPTYTDTGLAPGSAYSYLVKVRDKSINNNETGFSTALAATTTAPDTTAPTPNPMSWGTPPTAASSTSITMTATSASDPSGVQYFFDCTTAGGHDSAWQDSPTYTDTGLAPSSSYSYQVRARDKSINHNETGFSTALAATTAAPVAPSLEVHEPFNFVAPDTTLSGNAGGTGLSGNWTTTSTTAVEAANLTYGSLSTSGSAIVASGYNTASARVGIGPTALSGLLNDGGGLWMSFLYRYGGNATNTRFALGIGDSYLSANGNLFNEDSNVATNEQAIGFAAVFNTNNGDIPMIWDTNTYDGGNINGDPTFVTPPSTSPGLTSGSSAGYGFTPTNDTTYLVVLHAQWGADGSTNDTVTLYLPGTDLALGTAVTTYQAIVSQDSFDTLFFTADQTLGTLDEIRVGATYADVVSSTGGGSAFDTWATSGTATGVTFGGDANGDGVQDGMAFLLGADTPDDKATGLLQTASVGGGLVMNFTMLDPASSAPAVLSLSHSGDLGLSDPWSAPVAVPGTTSTVGGIGFVVSGSGTLSVEATIPATGNALDGKLFGHLVAEE